MDKARLSDLAKIVSGQPAPKDEDFGNDGIPFIRAGHIESLMNGFSEFNLPKINEVNAKKLRLSLIPVNSLLFAKSGMSATKNRVYKTANPSYIVSHLAGILPSDKFYQNYLAWYLKWYGPSKLILDDSYPSIRLSDIADLEIPLPPLDTQKKIVAMLDKADELRQNDKKILEKYDQLAQSVFLDMFGNPEKSNNKVIPLGDVCYKITDGTHQSPKFAEKGIPFLFVSNIINKKITYETNKFIPEEEYRNLTKSTPIEVGDLLFTTVGSYGNPAIVISENKFCFQRHIAHLKPNHNRINVYFLHAMLSAPFVTRQVDKLVRGVAQKTLNLRELKSILIIRPAINIQEEFAKIVKNIEEQKQLTILSLQKSEELFQSLIQRAFR